MVVAPPQVVSPPPKPPSARARLKEWIRPLIHEPEEFLAPKVRDKASEHFRPNREFMAEVGDEAFDSWVYEIVLEVVAETHAIPDEDFGAVPPANGAVGTVDRLEGGQSYISPTQSTDTRAKLKKRLSTLEKKWRKWKEHVKDRHMSLLGMKPEHLEIAEAEHRKRALAPTNRADFLFALRKGMQPEETVGQHYKTEQIELLYNVTIGGKGDHYGHLRRARESLRDLFGTAPVPGQDHGGDAPRPEARDGLAEGPDGGGRTGAPEDSDHPDNA